MDAYSIGITTIPMRSMIASDRSVIVAVIITTVWCNHHCITGNIVVVVVHGMYYTFVPAIRSTRCRTMMMILKVILTMKLIMMTIIIIIQMITIIIIIAVLRLKIKGTVVSVAAKLGLVTNFGIPGSIPWPINVRLC